MFLRRPAQPVLQAPTNALMPNYKLDRQQQLTFCTGHALIFMLDGDGHRHADPVLGSYPNSGSKVAVNGLRRVFSSQGPTGKLH